MDENSTLLEVLKQCNADGFVRLLFDKYDYLCRSSLMDGGREASWKKFCLTPEHRSCMGCYKCRAEMLNMTLKEIEEVVHG